MAALYETFDYSGEVSQDSLNKLAKSLSVVGKAPMFVHGFLVASVRRLNETGNKDALIVFMDSMSETRNFDVIVKLLGKLSGVDNKGKPNLSYSKGKGLKWTSREKWTVDESVAERMMAAHGKESFVGKTFLADLFPKRETSPDLAASVKRTVAKLHKADMDRAAILALVNAALDAEFTVNGKAAMAA